MPHRRTANALLPLLLFVFVLFALPLQHARATDALPDHSFAVAAPPPPPGVPSPPSSYWMQNIARNGTVPYGNPDAQYKVFRNVRDYGAVGDGIANDTAAINAAIADGNRCGSGCDSSTTTPAIVYFPAGTYLISTPIIMYYMTQLVGDATSLPVIKGMPDFYGIALLDSDVYYPGGASWYTNQNNFYRQVRNFVLDLTAMPVGYGAGIHWQVAQATSLQNIVFEMVEGGGEDNAQRGIFMDNGSGGWIGDLVFNGGSVGMYMGNQQFTVRNITFNGCQTAVYQNWGWVLAYKHFVFNNCPVGLDITHGGQDQIVGSIVLADSSFNNVSQAILTSWDYNTTPVSGGTLVIDNCDFTGSPAAVSYPNGTLILEGGGLVESWVQGRAYTTYFTKDTVGKQTCYEPGATGVRMQQELGAPPKPEVLLDSSGRFVERYKPQYEGEPLSAFVSVKANGAAGDGVTDDTMAIQAIFDSATFDQVIYFDHGAYVISDTIQVPSNIRITGECWPMIMALGTAFNDMSRPKPVWRVGQVGSTGRVEISDIVFETLGPAPGAIMVEWNIKGTEPAAAAMWDTHWRIGGTDGTNLQSTQCLKNPQVLHAANDSCIGSFMLLHITEQASVYMENNWGWVADHELDLPSHDQIDIYNGRGVLIESTQGVWMLGSSFEHSMLYNYQISTANNIYMSVIQSETAYMQTNPNALTPFAPNSSYNDPTFANCFESDCYKTWGLRISESNNVFNYGAGLYSFFDNYDGGCVITESCQENMVSVEDSSTIYLYALSTEASTNMVSIDGVAVVPQTANMGTFCQTVVLFEEP